MESDKLRNESFLWVDRSGILEKNGEPASGACPVSMNWKVAITINKSGVSRATFTQVIHRENAHKFSRFFVARKSAGIGIFGSIRSAVVENMLQAVLFALGT